MPFDLLTDPRLFLRLDDASPFAVNPDGSGGTPSDGAPCAFWGDLGPNGWPARQLGSLSAPPYAANVLNGRPGLVWPSNRGLRTALSLGTAAGLAAAEAADFTILVVAQVGDNNDTNCLLSRWNGDGNRWHLNGTGGSAPAGGAGNRTGVLFTAASLLDSSRAVVGVSPAVVTRFALDGAVTSGNYGDPRPADPAIPVVIGTTNVTATGTGGGNFLVGTVYAVYGYGPPALTPAELLQAELQIRTRYGLAWPGASAPAFVVWDGNSISFDGGLIADVLALPSMAAYPAAAVFNLSWPQKTTGNMNTFAAADADALYDVLAPLGKPVESLNWELTNDLIATASASATFANAQTYQAARLAKGFKRVLGTMLPRTGMNALKDAVNALIYGASPAPFEGLADVASDPLMGQDGQDASTTYYLDGTHPTALGRQTIAPYFAGAILAAAGTPRRRRRGTLSPLAGRMGVI